MPDPDVHQSLPLTPTVFSVLLALADGPKHGYAVMQEVEQASDGAVRLAPGTLYGIAKRLLADGWIVEAKDPREKRTFGGPPRRSYALTPLGRAVALAEADRLEELLQRARKTGLADATGEL